jgi:prevent-host-death family protein
MKTIGATEFKQKCLALLDRLEPEGLIITKHGKAVARVIPVETDSADLIGKFAHRIVIRGDIDSTGLAWDAQS